MARGVVDRIDEQLEETRRRREARENEPPDRLSAEEQTEVDQAVERITEKGYIFRGMDR